MASQRKPAKPRGAAKERAYAYTKQRGLDSRFPGGSMLSEGEVANALELSRTPVREAFTQLESEGLLRLYPKRGALVVPVSAAELEDGIETRWVIERYAIERAIAAPGDVVAALCRLTERQEELTGGEFVEADRAFHRTLVEATGNRILLGLYDSLRDRQRRMGRAT